MKLKNQFTGIVLAFSVAMSSVTAPAVTAKAANAESIRKRSEGDAMLFKSTLPPIFFSQISRNLRNSGMMPMPSG